MLQIAGGGGKTLSYLLAAFFAFAAAQSAQAKMWEGKGSDTLWSTPENWENSTVPATTDSLAFRRAGAPNKTATLDGLYTYSGNLHVGLGSSASSPYIFEATDPSYGLTIKDDVWLGYYEDGWLWLKSGVYTFGVTSGHGLSLGGNTSTTHHNFWLKVGDGSSTVSLTAKSKDINLWGGSTIIADKATLDFTTRNFKINNTASLYMTNSIISGVNDLNVGDNASANCVFKGVSSTVHLTGSGNVFNIGFGSGSTGLVEKEGGDWDCYYLRIGMGTNSTGTFNMNGGSLTVKTELGIGRGANSTGTFNMNGGSLIVSSSNYPYIGSGTGSVGNFEIADGDVTLSTAYITVGEGSGIGSATMTVKRGGSFTANANWGILLGRYSPGTLNVEGGTVTLGRLNFCYRSGSGGSVANITDGGVVAVNSVYVEQNNEAAALNIDGGTLKARQNNNAFIPGKANFSVAVGDSGAVFDTSGYNITIGGAISDKDGEAGKVKFMGGSTVTITNEASWTGGTVVELGTKLVVSDATAKATILSDLVVDGRVKLKAADYTLLEYADGGLTDADLANITFRDCGEGTSAKIVDGTKVVVSLVSLPCIVKTSAIMVWPGKTLDEVAYGTFTARMCGAAMGESKNAIDSAMGYNKKLFADGNGSVTNIIVEYQVYDDVYTKCVVVSFENGADGVYARALGAAFVSGQHLGNVFYPGTLGQALATTPTSSGYGVCDLRVVVEEAAEWTLDQDRTWSELRNGAVLSADSVVRILVNGDSPVLTVDENVDVGRIELVNAMGNGCASTNSIAVAAGNSMTYGALCLNDNVCLVAGDFEPTSLEIAAGSRILYASGEAVCAPATGLGCVEVADGATVYVDNDVMASYILNNGTVVKRVAADVVIPFHNGSKGVTVVSNGTLKASRITSVTGNPYAFVTDENPHANQLIDVKAGATYDLNGVNDISASVRLEEGAHIANTGANIDAGKLQTVQIVLDGDATATATSQFGILAPGHAETRLELGSHTLTLNGANSFWLVNTTILGDGEIAVEGGTLTCTRSSIGTDCALRIGASGTLQIDGVATLTVKDFFNSGTVYNDNGMLTVTGTLTTGNDIKKLTLADGATVKATGTAQTVSTTFSASGTYTIDASEITKEQLIAAEDGRIGVLTVPTAQVGGTWTVVNAPVRGTRARWEIDAGGTTSTFCLRRPVGMVFIVK